MDVERLRRMAGEGDQDARAELSHRMVRRTSTAEMVDVALRDGSMTTAVKALDAASSTGLLGYAGRNDRQRWAHMSGVVAAYRKRVLLDYLASGMTQKIWVLPVRATRDATVLGACRTPYAHQKDIWKCRAAHILTEEGVELALFRGKQHTGALRSALALGAHSQPGVGLGRAGTHIMNKRPWVSVAYARRVAHFDRPGLQQATMSRHFTRMEVDAAIASVLITGEVTT